MAFGMSNYSGNVLRYSTTTGQSGEVNESWSTHLSGVPCRLQLRGPGEAVYTGKESVLNSATMYCDPNTDIIISDRIDDSGTVYEVKGTDPDHDHMGAYMKVELTNLG